MRTLGTIMRRVHLNTPAVNRWGKSSR